MVAQYRNGALISADAPNAAVYRANAAAYVAKLEALDEEIVQAAETAPRERRKIVTSHDALGYFGERYGFDIVGEVINSLSTEAGEPSAQEIVKLVDAIKAQEVKAIFPESITSPKLVERVAVEAGVKIGGSCIPTRWASPGRAARPISTRCGQCQDAYGCAKVAGTMPVMTATVAPRPSRRPGV